MAISLAKGQRISLEKTSDAPLTQVFMGLGWDPAQKKGGFLSSVFGGGGGGDSIDLDASCLMFDGAKRLVDTVWFRQLKSQDGSIKHSGDNLTGDGDGDDEIVYIDLTRVPANVSTLVFTVNSFRGQTFNEVGGASCRLVDQVKNKELVNYKLSGGGNHTGMIMAKLVRNGAGWDMQALGEPGRGSTANDMLPGIQALI